jgi:hypothetical protein
MCPTPLVGAIQEWAMTMFRHSASIRAARRSFIGIGSNPS